MANSDPELQRLLPFVLPKAIAWAEAQSAVILQCGIPLDPAQISRARQVGVAHPEKIRLLMVDALPLPEDPELRTAAIKTGLFSQRIEGMTLGYGILLIRRCVQPRLVSHECRHVYQVEQAGSLANFLPIYLKQIAEVGYDDAPFERDAYAAEFD